MESYLTLDDIVEVKEISLDTVYDIEVENQHSYYLDCGKPILVHNSSKTWSIFYFWILKAMKGEKFLLTIGRSKMTWTRDSLLMDFEEICAKEEFPVTPDVNKGKQVQEYKILNATFQFIGLDDVKKIHGQKRDYLWLNEVMEIGKKDFDQLEMRTSKMIILDYNPYDDTHWVFNLQRRKDVCVIHSTMLDNPNNPPEIINKIKSYEPTEENIAQGTADLYMWEVYGLGKKARLQGAVFTNWDIQDLPRNTNGTILPELKGMGLDFGYTNDPSCLVEMYMMDNEIYVNEIFYQTGMVNEDISRAMELKGIAKDVLIAGDSAEPKSIEEIRRTGFNIKPVEKGADSINYGIDLLKAHKIHLTKNSINGENEMRKYKWQEDKNGNMTNKPIDDFNHFIDALRYIAMMTLANRRPARVFKRKANVFA
jgi:phage terminase large subunit